MSSRPEDEARPGDGKSDAAKDREAVICQQRHNWPGLKAVVMIESERRIDAKLERETRFYITSSTDKADELGDVVRRHWSVESMHRLMNCRFRDEQCRIRAEHAPANFTTIKHIAQHCHLSAG